MYTSQDRVSIVIPLTPPSVNHYKVPATKNTRNGPRKTFILTPEAKGFLEAVAIFSRGQTLIPETEAGRKSVRYALLVTVYQGYLPLREGESKQRTEQGDGDNYWKCVADGLGKKWAGVIHDDRRVRTWIMDVREDDRHNPRTEILAVRCGTPSFCKAIEEFMSKIREEQICQSHI